MFDLVSKIWSNEEKEQNPQVDVHQDENAEIGDIRYIIKTEGQIFGYEKDRNKINLVKQVYTEGGSFHDGRKIFKWRRKKKVFRGTIKEWNEAKEKPHDNLNSVPENLDNIVEFMDHYIEMNKEYINKKEYPHSILET